MSKICLAALVGLLPAACGSQLGNLESAQSDTVDTSVEKSAFNADHIAACGEGGLTTEGTANLIRWPYLQKMTQRGVDILWTSAPSVSPATVEVTTPDGELVTTAAASIDATRAEHIQYVTSIDGLEPETMYCYQVVGDDGSWLTRTGFRTAPAANSLAPIRIAAIGDLGTRTSDQFAVRDQLMNVEFDMVIVVGDLAYETGTLSDHENNFFGVYRELMLNIPFFVISGNHDYASDGAVYREVFALFENGGFGGIERWYSFDWGQIHFTAIDTEQLTEAQADWVEDDLAATLQPWKIAFMHKPAYSSGTHGSDSTIQGLFAPSFEQSGVDLVLAGHDHNFERTNPINGVTYVTTGSAGRGTRPVGASSFTAYAESVAHFTHITIDQDGLQLNAIDAVGGDFDRVILE